MKKDIYRKAALERVATADQLDKMMKITSPLSWLALIGATAIIVLVVVWSFIGSLPYTITVDGMIVDATTATNTLISNGDGTVELQFGEGEWILPGDVVAKITLKNPNGAEEVIDCISDQLCVVSRNLVENYSAVELNTELMRIRPVPRDHQKHVIVCYVPFESIGRIEYGQKATITLTSDKDSTNAHMQGQIINIDRYVTSRKGIEAVVGSDNNMVNDFMKNGDVCAVTLEPAVSSNKTAKSEYWWSNEKGYGVEFNSSMKCQVKITTHEERPITKLFVKLRAIWGGSV